jgi:DNA repair protein RadA/Sms
MTRDKSQYRCRDCGSIVARWAGRCSRCGQWDTMDEEHLTSSGSTGSGPPTRSLGPPVPLASVSGSDPKAHPTGMGEMDRVLGGGLVPSSVTLIAGEPGIGKSTLLLQMLASLARRGLQTLLVSAEESPAQIGLRAARLGVADDGVWIAGGTDLASIRSAVAGLAPDVLVVDSIQTISDPAQGSVAGTVASVRLCASALADDAKSGGPAVVLVGHVTKDGSIAGPRVLEHLVDTVLSFEGERHQALRMLRAIKHRFGPVGELGMWEMTGTGLQEVADGGAFLLADRLPETPGSAIFAGLEGGRPLLREIQALVAPAGGVARRSASGYEPSRLMQLVAVLHRRAGVELGRHDVYVSAVGGVRFSDPGADLATAAAIASAATGRALPDDVVILGEVGLGGELRQVAQTPRRLAEAARLGFARALVPPGAGPAAGLEMVVARTLGEALDVMLAARPAKRPKLRVLAGAGYPEPPRLQADETIDPFDRYMAY